ncbi:hypothetical protein HJC23_001576 [Cyclotella cryptica]|uniref:Uncharacterized protein n=1 Tax=Cyclotella cryptica TaxID=29204 RepID=A0ABD3PW94_9STRA|eukprot:CCRYP_010802-RA/>CCRYP_010802-RA protein AED:0.43 eAED:0.43 QI:0/-1/0/1/-1/1/1/0/263
MTATLSFLACFLPQVAAFCTSTDTLVALSPSFPPPLAQNRRLSFPPHHHSKAATRPWHHEPLHSTSTNSIPSPSDTSSESSSPCIPHNPLQSAGLSFVSASTKSLGMLFYNIGGMDHKDIQALLLQAGTHLVEAGSSWDNDWDAVRDSMESAAHAFYDISNVFGSANIDESLELALLFENIGKELEDISTISGCCAIGPPSSCGNLLAVEEHLTEISRILKKNSVAATDEHMMCTLFKEVAELFRDMAERYLDETGQESEVSV